MCDAQSCLIVRDGARRQVGVNGHLLARHRVQGEARRHLGDAARSLRHDHEVDDRGIRKTTSPTSTFPSTKRPKASTTLPATLSLATVEQDQARRGHVEAEAQKSGDQNKGWKSAEFEGFFDEQSGQEDSGRQRDRKGQ